MKKLIVLVVMVSSFNVLAGWPKSPATGVIDAVEVLSEQNLECSDSRDCSFVAIGSRACGGPAGFTVVSRLNSKLTQIQTLASLSEVLADDYNRENGVISICVLAVPPVTACTLNKCERVN